VDAAMVLWMEFVVPVKALMQMDVVMVIIMMIVEMNVFQMQSLCISLIYVGAVLNRILAPII
jgi:hypothetical protein